MTDYGKSWGERASTLLVGRTIVAVSYLSVEEASEMGWEYGRPVALELDNGVVLFPSSDDEGNAAGALFTTAEALPTIPVIL